MSKNYIEIHFWQKARVQWLLRQHVVGWIKLPGHDINIDAGL
jgi:hypothetical protein